LGKQEKKLMDKGIKSPFTLIFGILASLVIGDYFKNSSTAIASSTSILNAIPIILVAIISGAWIFYTLYGTVVWLMVTEHKPREVGLPTSGIFVKMLLLRFLEFLPFICLYDIVNTMAYGEVKLSNIRTLIAPNVIVGVGVDCLQRLSVDIALILILWAVWSFLWELFSSHFDLHLQRTDASANLKNTGPNLVIVALVGSASTLHIHIFNACSKKVFDEPEDKLKSDKIPTNFKSRLNDALNKPDSLTTKEKQKIITDAIKIAGDPPINKDWCSRIRQAWSCICQARTLGLLIAGCSFLVYSYFLPKFSELLPCRFQDSTTIKMLACPPFQNPPIPVSWWGLVGLVVLTLGYFYFDFTSIHKEGYEKIDVLLNQIIDKSAQ
jgi:hypothetical protein